MKLCLSVEIQEGMTYPETLAVTRSAEALGFDAALLAEHYYPSGYADAYAGGLGSRSSPDAWIYLGGLARETSRIRLGTLVSPVTFRHPVVLAKMAATLDRLSDGRAELGIGAGWLEPEHQAYGFEFAEPARRVDLVEEQLQVVSGLWTEDPFSHDGKAYKLEGAHFTPKPVQRPRPTIIVGGRTTSQRLARLAARYADEFVIGQPTPDQCRQVRAHLDADCARYGRDPKEVRLATFAPFCVCASRSEVDRTLDLYRRTNPQYVRMMDDLSTWLLGTPEQVQQQLGVFAACGVDRLMVSVNCQAHLPMLELLPPSP
jgi:probable F420-dependent oxidoreductase